ncbi:MULTISPECIES: hypothetical protein [Nostocales]|uniref:Uncharacterized protein n=3 Tax=Nostocales TaxID=1161 RepID=A0A0C1NK02_9CYAN|nr:hypothetical protein [Tolypothrix bouteillei]KAF3887872.1 hypothetical protein DA73_0400022040 [Tolypothrix bouteillei VB521301]
MSAKLKLLLIVVFSIFATAATGIYITQRQPSAAVSKTSNEQPQRFVTTSQQGIVGHPERANYQEIPLESLNSSLKGSDPTDLALNAFERDLALRKGAKKIEVSYPQPNRVLVTITQTKQENNSAKTAKYRVELTTFGRSLFVSSPQMWQIVWAGSQECFANSSQKNCHS